MRGNSQSGFEQLSNQFSSNDSPQGLSLGELGNVSFPPSVALGKADATLTT